MAHAQQRAALRDLLTDCGADLELFEDTDMDILLENRYCTVRGLQSATRQGLNEAGLPPGLVDHILSLQDADRKVAQARLKEAKARLARAEADRKVAEADQKEAEARLTRQQDAPGAVAGRRSAEGGVATADMALKDQQDEGKRLLAEWAHCMMGGKEKTV